MSDFLENIKNNMRNLQHSFLINPQNNMNLSFDDYISYVTSLARGQSTLQFHNKGIGHAKIVFSNIFDQSKKEIFWYTGCLDKKVVDNSLMVNLLDFIQQGGKLNVKIEDKDERTHEKLYSILEFYSLKLPNQVKLSKANHKAIIDDKEVHFLVGDNKMYRLETSKDNFEADCCFNDSEVAESLIQTFNTL